MPPLENSISYPSREKISLCMLIRQRQEVLRIVLYVPYCAVDSPELILTAMFASQEMLEGF